MAVCACQLLLTKTQEKYLMGFVDCVTENYSLGLYAEDIKRCLTNCSRAPLLQMLFAGAHGWFCNKNISFSSVYELIDKIADVMLKKAGY